jgi:hypothetical protein
MSLSGITNRSTSAVTGLESLARACDGELARSAAVPGAVRASLVRDWRGLAGADLSDRVLRHWPANLNRGELDQSSDAWMAAAAWLALHQLLIIHGWRGDALAFAQDWHQLVLAKLGRPARWALRAWGLERAVGHLPQLWGHAYRAPVPVHSLRDGALTLEFAAHELLDVPLTRLLLACQARLACELLTAHAQSIEFQQLNAGWSLRCRNLS